jgi:hypothetical protein
VWPIAFQLHGSPVYESRTKYGCTQVTHGAVACRRRERYDERARDLGAGARRALHMARRAGLHGLVAAAAGVRGVCGRGLRPLRLPAHGRALAAFPPELAAPQVHARKNFGCNSPLHLNSSVHVARREMWHAFGTGATRMAALEMP